MLITDKKKQLTVFIYVDKNVTGRHPQAVSLPVRTANACAARCQRAITFSTKEITLYPLFWA